MANITLRNTKGSPLTSTELDNNFANLNTDIASRITATGLQDAIKAIDGVGSGIDADTVRGLVNSSILPIATDKSSIITRDSSGNFSAGAATLQGTTVSGPVIELNAGGTGNRYAYIDFHGDDTYSDYSLRVIRENTGANAFSRIIHRGTGDLALTTVEAAPITLRTGDIERMRIDTAGNVGIGTNTPNGRLDVTGVANNITLATIQSVDGSMSRLTLANTNRNWTISNYGSQFSPNGAFIIADEQAAAVRLVIDTAGNTGFSCVPTYQLHVRGTGQETSNLTDAGLKGGSLYLQATGLNAGSGGAVLFGTTFGNQTPFAAIKGYITDGTTNTVGNLTFSTRATVSSTALTERMCIDYNGNVGIGTSTPFAKLAMNGGTLGATAGDQLLYQALQSSTGGNFDNLLISNTRQIAGSSWESCGTRLQQKVDNTWMGYIQFNGGTGPTTINPGGISFGTGQTNASATAIPERMRIDSAGNVGIGQNPTAARVVINKVNDPVTAASYTTGNLELASANTPPILGFHYAGVVARTIHLDSNGHFQSIANSGVTERVFHGEAPGIAPLYACRAWVNFNGLLAATLDILTVYVQSNTTTVTIGSFPGHGYVTGNFVNLVFTTPATGRPVDGIYPVTVIDANTFTITQAAARTASGNVIVKRNPIRASGNVSSVTDNATGDYTINFAVPMTDANYAVSGMVQRNSTDTNMQTGFFMNGAIPTQTSAAFRVQVRVASNAVLEDPTVACYAIFR
jgi:hypothetical protein